MVHSENIDNANTVKIIAAWADRLLQSGRCTDFTFQIYERELERYGGDDAMTQAEAIFFAESRCSADLLAACLGQHTNYDMMELCVLSLDSLLGSLNLDVFARANWLLASEDSSLFGDEFRKRKTRVRALVGANLDEIPQNIRNPLWRRNSVISEAWKRILALAPTGRLAVDPAELRAHLRICW